MSEKRTKFDKSQRSPERLDKRGRVESEINAEPVAVNALEEQIRLAYELYEGRGRKGR